MGPHHIFGRYRVMRTKGLYQSLMVWNTFLRAQGHIGAMHDRLEKLQ